jgi:GT2 family glycosyltransferase/glycosyltransferase involved in cell wall biosynthesis
MALTGMDNFLGAAGERARFERLLSLVVDPVWYRARNHDVAVSGTDPLQHFIDAGLHEWRDPNRWFDSAWYARQYADVAASGVHPLLHYLAEGATQRRDPHPRFDAAWYVDQHPEAAGNPLLFHLRVGASRGWLTEQPLAIEDYLPSDAAPFAMPDNVETDVIIPVYRGLAATRRCIGSVLADPQRPAGRVVVIDDRSPEPKLSAWLDGLAKSGGIILLRNKKNLGFVQSANLGMRHAGKRDVVLLNSDTKVPPGWLARLQAQAHAAPKVASVSPLSNNATICGLLSYEGGPMPPGMTLEAIDAACRAANAGRFAPAPTTVGFCMYIRREALDQVGLFDTKSFAKGYGEENDFCLRATASGWSHRIACDTFVYHEGNVSFGATTGDHIARAWPILTERYPEYPAAVAKFVKDGETEPFRFAAAMAMFRASGLPTILAVSHDLGGGVGRQMMESIARDAGHANHLVLAPTTHGVSLSAPALPGLPPLVLVVERWRDLATVARSAGVTRVHIHHLMGLELDVRALIHDLGVKFDVTVHDYFAICPQVTLLPWSAGAYCGEPGPAGCDACIANRPSHGATDILSWRLRQTWQSREAEHINVPSQDALDLLRRHGAGANARLVPHESVTAGPWPLRLPPRPGKRLRVAVLGVLANHKGAHLVASVVMAADPAQLEIQLIGDTETGFPEAARKRMTINGAYQEGELPGLLAKYRPHAIWFPSTSPETYSFTLSAAIQAGLPIIATRIGAFPERLAGRTFTWLLEPTPDPAQWLALFETVAEALRAPPRLAAAPVRPAVRGPAVTAPAPPKARLAPALVDLRRAGTTAVVVIPETFDDGSFTPCAYIRLLLPLDHPRSGGGVTVTLANPGIVSRYQADVIVTQRHALASVEAADSLAAHAKRTGAALIYDLDDDLLSIPPDHPEAAHLVPKAAVVERMVRLAGVVHTSTTRLARRLAPLARQVQVVANALDERIWLAGSRPREDSYGPVRLLCMGSATHDGDFALILPALIELRRQFGEHVQLDLMGFVSSLELPAWIRRVPVPLHATRSYPGFVQAITRAGPWDIGLAPLADTRFNLCKSAIKTLDYAALGLATLASDVPAYRGSVADGPGGRLVANTPDAWREALSWLVRDAQSRRLLAETGARELRRTGILDVAPRPGWPRLAAPPQPGPSPIGTTKKRARNA